MDIIEFKLTLTLGDLVVLLGVAFAAVQIFLDRRMRTVDYVSAQLGRNEIQEGRQWLIDMKDAKKLTPDIERKKRVRELLDKVPVNSPLERQVIQFCHSCNRIGAGVRLWALDRRIVDALWAESWFRERWEIIEKMLDDHGKPVIIGKKPYLDFQRLAGIAK